MLPTELPSIVSPSLVRKHVKSGKSDKSWRVDLSGAANVCDRDKVVMPVLGDEFWRKYGGSTLFLASKVSENKNCAEKAEDIEETSEVRMVLVNILNKVCMLSNESTQQLQLQAKNGENAKDTITEVEAVLQHLCVQVEAKNVSSSQESKVLSISEIIAAIELHCQGQVVDWNAFPVEYFDDNLGEEFEQFEEQLSNQCEISATRSKRLQSSADSDRYISMKFLLDRFRAMCGATSQTG